VAANAAAGVDEVAVGLSHAMPVAAPATHANTWTARMSLVIAISSVDDTDRSTLGVPIGVFWVFHQGR
jgi:hypothetical protein